MILDTNALSAAADGDHAALSIIATSAYVGIPVVVLGEYRLGITQSRYRNEYQEWLERFVLDVAVLEIENETSFHYAALGLELKRLGRPIPVNDLWIASLCRQHSMPLLSRDHHFDVISEIQRIEW